MFLDRVSARGERPTVVRGSRCTRDALERVGRRGRAASDAEVGEDVLEDTAHGVLVS